MVLLHLYLLLLGQFHLSDIIFVQFQENKEGLELLKTAIAKAGYTGKVSAHS